MTISQMDKVVKHQVLLSLNNRDLTIQDIGTNQYQKELYNMALKLLVELK